MLHNLLELRWEDHSKKLFWGYKLHMDHIATDVLYKTDCVDNNLLSVGALHPQTARCMTALPLRLNSVEDWDTITLLRFIHEQNMHSHIRGRNHNK